MAKSCPARVTHYGYGTDTVTTASRSPCELKWRTSPAAQIATHRSPFAAAQRPSGEPPRTRNASCRCRQLPVDTS